MYYALRFSWLAALAAACLLLLIPRPSLAAQVTITMTDNQFSPKNVIVNPGDTVVFINQGSMAHTATADNGSFDTGTIQPGQSYAAIFNGVATYVYHCKFHGNPGGLGMAGTIAVVGSGGGTPASTPVSTNANTSAQLAAQAQALLNQIAALKAQLGGGTSGATAGGTAYDSSACPLIGRSLKVGVSGDDVTRLQQFLARDPSIYPEAQVTGYYGALTQAAVQRWQVKYHIVSSGTPESTGYGVVGPRTAAAIAILCTTGSYGGVAGPSAQSPVGGFITVTPISGTAPLLVSITATVNTTNSCTGAIYTLDFGDGTNAQQIPVSAGNCNQVVQNYPHTYQYGGTYQIKLSSGTHQTSATIVVSGPAAPPPTPFTSGLPAESFSASPQSGTAPLAVTFSGTVNSNDKGFCAGGCASVLDFGDGTSGTVNLPASVGGWLNYSLTHTYAQTGGYKATLYQGGAGAAQPIVGSATVIVNAASSGGGGGTTTSTYPPPIVIGNVGGNPLSVQIQFDLPGCPSYTLSWGDGSQGVSSNSTSCFATGAGSTPTILSHTYAQSGVYTIALTRGSQVNDASVTISN